MKSGQHRVAVDAAGADLAHQVHAHAVPAEREERAVPEAQNAGIAPHQIEAQRQHREAQVFAEQRHEVIGHAPAREHRCGSQRLSAGTAHDRARAPASTAKAGPQEAWRPSRVPLRPVGERIAAHRSALGLGGAAL